MTLPSQKLTPEQIINERPNDEVFPSVKPYLQALHERSEALKKDLIDLVLDDMVFDHALSSALDEVGVVLEYQAQAEGIERPQFNGQGLIKSAERVSRIKFSLSLCSILGLSEEAATQVLLAEIERLWFEGQRNATKDKQQPPALKLPDEVNSLLRDVARGLMRNKHGNEHSTANQRNAQSNSGRAGKKSPPNGGA